MAHKLVIVESPAKARTIGGYLGKDYVVESSIGHIRDLPNNAADTPAKIKDKPWGRLAVDVDNEFTPYYVVPRDKKSHISKLKSLLKDADELFLATDEDREGEAIAWHLLDELKPKGIPVKRMVFHEITKQAILDAADNPRELAMDLVEAQETRRILDRLYGYEVSPVLWKKVMSGLSAGRVQSVATRLVVDKERQRMAFKIASYWDLEGTFDAGSKHDQRMFPAKLHSLDGTRVATGASFGPDGQLKGKSEVVHLDRTRAESLVSALADTTYDVRSVEAKPYRRSPYAPFRTTTLQQEAGRKLGMSASVTDVGRPAPLRERLHHLHAHRLHDAVGRGDPGRAQSRPVSSTAPSTSPTHRAPTPPRSRTPRRRTRRSAPPASRSARPAQTGLTGDQFRLYELIWMRTVASQMKDATGQSVSIRIGGAADDRRGRRVRRLRPRHHLPRLPQGLRRGHRRRRRQGRPGDPAARPRAGRRGQRRLAERQRPRDQAAGPLHRGHADQGARGARDRPALDVRLDHRHDPQPRLRLQEGHGAGAGLAGVLGDPAAGGALPAARVLRVHRRHGGRARRDRRRPQGPRHRAHRVLLRLRRRPGPQALVDGLGDIDAKELATFPVGGPDSGINLRVGRYGPYLEGPDDEGNPVGKRANVPDDLPPDELTLEKATELFANPAGEEIELGNHPETGLRVVAKNGRYGPYVTEDLPEDAKKNDKPRTGSLFKSMSLDTITLDDAVKLLSLPRVVGVAPPAEGADGEVEGEEITAQNGRYGPYLKKGTDSRSLTTEDQLFTVTLDEALKIYAQPKQRGRAAAAPPLKELGNDPVSGQPIVVKSGRFGEYVTDGEYNATLRKDDSVESITTERAAELLADRRERGPAKKAAKKGAKKAPAKKAPPRRRPPRRPPRRRRRRRPPRRPRPRRPERAGSALVGRRRRVRRVAGLAPRGARSAGLGVGAVLVVGLAVGGRNTISTMKPTSGTSPMRYHQPLRPVSCRRRTAAARPGRNIASAPSTESSG